MKILLKLLLLMLICDISNAGNIEIPYINGSASITIDGILNEWEPINCNVTRVYNVENMNTSNYYENNEVYYQCFCDQYNLFVAIDVIDSNLLFGEERLGNFYWDDAVRISFQNIRHSEINKLRLCISADEDGNPCCEYSQTDNLVLPYIWESMGVKYSLKTKSNGYTVEIAIPIDVIGINGDEVNFNIVVFDDDDGEDYEYSYQTAVDSDVSLSYSHHSIINKAYNNSVGNVNYDNSYSTSKADIIELLNYVWNNENEIAKNMLNIKLNTNNKWAKPLLAVIEYRLGEYEESADLFREIMNECPDFYIKSWSMSYLQKILLININQNESAEKIYNEQLYSPNWYDQGFAVLYSRLSEYMIPENSIPSHMVDNITNSIILKDIAMKQSIDNYDNAIIIFDEALSCVDKYKPWTKCEILIEMARLNVSRQYNKNQSANYLREVLSIYPDRDDIKLSIIDLMMSSGLYEESYKLYESQYNNAKTVEERMSASIGLAQIYYHIGFYENAKKRINEVLNSNIDNKIKINARLLLLSLENNM